MEESRRNDRLPPLPQGRRRVRPEKPLNEGGVLLERGQKVRESPEWPVYNKSASLEPESESSFNRSFVMSKSNDLSVSSIISNLSLLLNGNTSSSFLVKVDDDGRYGKKRVPAVQDEAVQEVLRRMSSVDGLNHPSISGSLNRHVPSFAGENGEEKSLDSWDEFDKVMERSLPPKEFELHEFEEFAQDSIRPDPEDEDLFVSAEEAQAQMDRDGRDREQFMKSANATFLSANPSFALDPLSVTNYFRERSSFPGLGAANESTMMHFDEGNKTLQGLDPKVVGRTSLLLTEIVERPSIVPSAKEIANYLTGSQSDGADSETIVRRILEACKASAESKRPKKQQNSFRSQHVSQLDENAPSDDAVMANPVEEVSSCAPTEEKSPYFGTPRDIIAPKHKLGAAYESSPSKAKVTFKLPADASKNQPVEETLVAKNRGANKPAPNKSTTVDSGKHQLQSQKPDGKDLGRQPSRVPVPEKRSVAVPSSGTTTGGRQRIPKMGKQAINTSGQKDSSIPKNKSSGEDQSVLLSEPGKTSLDNDITSVDFETFQRELDRPVKRVKSHPQEQRNSTKAHASGTQDRLTSMNDSFTSKSSAFKRPTPQRIYYEGDPKPLAAPEPSVNPNVMNQHPASYSGMAMAGSHTNGSMYASGYSSVPSTVPGFGFPLSIHIHLPPLMFQQATNSISQVPSHGVLPPQAQYQSQLPQSTSTPIPK